MTSLLDAEAAEFTLWNVVRRSWDFAVAHPLAMFALWAPFAAVDLVGWLYAGGFDGIRPLSVQIGSAGVPLASQVVQHLSFPVALAVVSARRGDRESLGRRIGWGVLAQLLVLGAVWGPVTLLALALVGGDVDVLLAGDTTVKVADLSPGMTAAGICVAAFTLFAWILRVPLALGLVVSGRPLAEALVVAWEATWQHLAAMFGIAVLGAIFAGGCACSGLLMPGLAALLVPGLAAAWAVRDGDLGPTGVSLAQPPSLTTTPARSDTPDPFEAPGEREG